MKSIFIVILLLLSSCGGGTEPQELDYYSIGDDVCIKLFKEPAIVSDFRLGPPIFYEILHLDEYNIPINSWLYWYELSPIEECSGQRIVPDIVEEIEGGDFID